MSSALSPTSVAVTSESGPTSSKEFSEHVKYYQQAHKAIVRLTALVNRLPSSQPLKIGNHNIRRSDVNKYSQAFVSQLGDLRKLYSSRKKRKGKNNSQLNALFYVSDQLVDFYDGAKLGPADPSDPSQGDLSDEIEVLVKHRMSTSGILTSLISRYIDTNNLKAKTISGRFVPDSRMKQAFSDTKYMLNGKDLSKRKIRPDTTPEKREKVKEHISLGKKSAFARVSSRIDKKSGNPVYDTKTGLLYTTMMVFNNFYRIPGALITDEEKEMLTDPEVVDMSRDLQKTLSSITEWNNTQKRK